VRRSHGEEENETGEEENETGEEEKSDVTEKSEVPKKIDMTEK